MRDIEKKKRPSRKKIVLIFLTVLVIAAVFFFSVKRSKSSILQANVPPPPPGPSLLQTEPHLPNLVNQPLITAQPPSGELPYKEEVIAYLKALEKVLQDWEETERIDLAQQQLDNLLQSLFSPEAQQEVQESLKIYDYYISQKQKVLQELLSLSPPPPCINLHYHYKTAFEESIQAIAGIREGIYSRSKEDILKMLSYQMTINKHMAQAEAEEDSLRRIYGLPPRSLSIRH
ncbi:MAG: hypothetical protein ACPLPS_01830 [bacterium]